jgi:hypothetical protein
VKGRLRDLPVVEAQLDPVDGVTLRRVDRKYVVGHNAIEQLLEVAAQRFASLALVDVAGAVEQHYETTYFDSPGLILYELARARRPVRCKIRVRSYATTGNQLLELKQRGRNGLRSKFRQPWHGSLDDAARNFLALHLVTTPLALHDRADLFLHTLAPSASTSYTRVALQLIDTNQEPVRITVDSDLRVGSSDGPTHSWPGSVILETKSAGKPSTFDRLLWSQGIRPTTISKYGLAISTVDPERPTNRWGHHVHGLRSLE